jgi:hypothetical protein
MKLKTTVRTLMTIALLAAFSLASFGCPPEKKDDDEHKPGDGHDHGDDKQKK